jgi:hypothetical protein
MGELREIVDLKQIEKLFLVLAVLLPAAGAALGVLRAQKAGGQGAVQRGLMWGCLGPLNYALWRMYSMLTARSGLDSLSNLLVNLVLFVGIGAGVGWLFGKTRHKVTEASSPEYRNSDPAKP